MTPAPLTNLDALRSGTARLEGKKAMRSSAIAKHETEAGTVRTAAQKKRDAPASTKSARAKKAREGLAIIDKSISTRWPPPPWKIRALQLGPADE